MRHDGRGLVPGRDPVRNPARKLGARCWTAVYSAPARVHPNNNGPGAREGGSASQPCAPMMGCILMGDVGKSTDQHHGQARGFNGQSWIFSGRRSPISAKDGIPLVGGRIDYIGWGPAGAARVYQAWAKARDQVFHVAECRRRNQARRAIPAREDRATTSSSLMVREWNWGGGGGGAGCGRIRIKNRS